MNQVRGHSALGKQMSTTVYNPQITLKKESKEQKQSVGKYSAISMGSENMPGKIPADKSGLRVELNNI